MKHRLFAMAVSAALTLTAFNADAQTSVKSQRMIVLFKDGSVARQTVRIGDRLETLFTDQRVAANPRIWEAVSLKAALLVRNLENRYAARAHIVFDGVSGGFAANLDVSQVAALRQDRDVAEVVPDAVGVPAAADSSPWLNRPGFGPGYNFTYGWNLYAIGAINYVSDAEPAKNNPSYRTNDGYPVKAYIIDAGIQPHADLNFNWQVDHISFDAHSNVGGACNPDKLGNCTDPTYSYQPVCSSHGTHVAGIVGATRQSGAPVGVEGVAPGVQLVSVRVNNYCYTTSNTYPGLTYLSSVLAAIQWVADQSVAAAGSATRTGAVANISILWNQVDPAHTNYITAYAAGALRDKIKDAVETKGVFFSFAAGNSNEPACNLLPGALGRDIGGAMAVGALGNGGLPMRDVPLESGKIATYGPCVELWAPGQSVQSTGAFPGTVLGQIYPPESDAWGPGVPYSPSSSNLYPGQAYYMAQSGSSMAAPHVAGAALLVLKKFSLAGQPLPGPVALEAYIQVPSRLKGMSPSYGGNPVPPGGSSWPVNMLQVNAY